MIVETDLSKPFGPGDFERDIWQFYCDGVPGFTPCRRRFNFNYLVPSGIKLPKGVHLHLKTSLKHFVIAKRNRQHASYQAIRAAIDPFPLICTFMSENGIDRLCDYTNESYTTLTEWIRRRRHDRRLIRRLETLVKEFHAFHVLGDIPDGFSFTLEDRPFNPRAGAEATVKTSPLSDEMFVKLFGISYDFVKRFGERIIACGIENRRTNARDFRGLECLNGLFDKRPHLREYELHLTAACVVIIASTAPLHTSEILGFQGGCITPARFEDLEYHVLNGRIWKHSGPGGRPFQKIAQSATQLAVETLENLKRAREQFFAPPVHHEKDLIQTVNPYAKRLVPISGVRLSWHLRQFARLYGGITTHISVQKLRTTLLVWIAREPDGLVVGNCEAAHRYIETTKAYMMAGDSVVRIHQNAGSSGAAIRNHFFGGDADTGSLRKRRGGTGAQRGGKQRR